MSGARQSNRQFGLMFAALFAIIAAIGWFAFDARLYWAAVLVVLFAALALICPEFLLPLNRLWGLLAQRLGRVNNYLLLGIFLYVVIFPTSVIMRILRVDPMDRRLEPSSNSYWRPVERHATAESFEDMF